MDRRTEIRDFLTSRRARITPEQAGLKVSPLAGVRRVAGLRREEVALLAGVSVPYYTRLERGDARGATDAVLDAIARALLLDDAERAHLFDLVRAANATAAAAQVSRHPARRGRPQPLRQGPVGPDRRAVHPRRHLPAALGPARSPAAPGRRQAPEPPARRAA